MLQTHLSFHGHLALIRLSIVSFWRSRVVFDLTALGVEAEGAWPRGIRDVLFFYINIFIQIKMAAVEHGAERL